MNPEVQPLTPPAGRPKIWRTRYLIDRPFQLNFSLLLVLIAAINTFFFSMLFFLYDQELAFVYQNLLALEKLPAEVAQTGFSILAKTIIFVAIFETVFIILLGIFFSHRIAGPLYNMRLRMKEMIAGRYPQRIRLRKDDMLHEFAGVMDELVQKLRSETLEEVQWLEAVAPQLHDAGQRQKLDQILARKKNAIAPAPVAPPAKQS